VLGNLLWRGLVAGLLAGVVGFGVARWIGEPQVDRAIAFEDYTDALHPAPDAPTTPDAPLVSRSEQRSSGLATGAVIFGVAIGGIFALVFAVGLGRLGTHTVRGTAALLGLLGFVAVYLTPFLKYPANPPAVGDPDTIGRRTGWYVTIMLIGVVAMVAAVLVRRRLVGRLGGWNATLAVVAGYAAVVVVAYALLPTIDEVPQQALPTVVGAVTDAGATFPPVVLWRFRMASLAIQAVIWAVLSLGFGVLAERYFRATGAPRRREHDDPLLAAFRS
jgi:predicted cobalt transporter CbtA